MADPDNGGKDVLVTGDDPDQPVDRLPLPAMDGRILDVSPEYVLYELQGPYKRQYVIDIVRDRIVKDRSVPATWDRGEETAAWNAQWWLSKPAASWKLTLHNDDTDTDTEVRTWSGESTASTVKASCDGTATDGATAPEGAYTWTLTATPADGQGDPVSVSGTLTVTGS